MPKARIVYHAKSGMHFAGTFEIESVPADLTHRFPQNEVKRQEEHADRTTVVFTDGSSADYYFLVQV